MEAQVNSKSHSFLVPSDIPAQVFRTYDIRGPVEEGSLTVDLAYAIGIAVGSEAQAQGRKEIIVGRDGRLSGPEFKKALITGLLESGCDVVDIGTVPTPLVYFATHFLEADSGVMVTASHNPGHHNGFKIVLAGTTLSTEGVQLLYQRICKREFVSGSGSLREQNIIPDYLKTICERISLKRPLKVVVDSGNGAAGEIAPALYRELGCEVIELFCDIDGNFPNHHPDPTVPENLTAILDAVKKEKADIGLAFDGDADRLGIVTNKGEIIWPDRQVMLFARDLLKKIPGADIVFDVKCSSNLPKVIKEYGGNPIMYRTGHSLLKAKMIDIGAPLAGEMSGHIFFKDGWFGFDDGIYVGARLLSILSGFEESASEVFAGLPNSVNTPELKLPMADAKKSDFMNRLLNDADFGDAEKITIDGLRVDFGYGWGLVRPSNTSSYLVLRFEADTAENLEQIKTFFRKQLLSLDSSLQLPF